VLPPKLVAKTINCKNIISDLAPAAQNTSYQFDWNVDDAGACEKGEPFSYVLSKIRYNSYSQGPTRANCEISNSYEQYDKQFI